MCRPPSSKHYKALELCSTSSRKTFLTSALKNFYHSFLNKDPAKAINTFITAKKICVTWCNRNGEKSKRYQIIQILEACFLNQIIIFSSLPIPSKLLISNEDQALPLKQLIGPIIGKNTPNFKPSTAAHISHSRQQLSSSGTMHIMLGLYFKHIQFREKTFYQRRFSSRMSLCKEKISQTQDLSTLKKCCKCIGAVGEGSSFIKHMEHQHCLLLSNALKLFLTELHTTLKVKSLALQLFQFENKELRDIKSLPRTSSLVFNARHFVIIEQQMNTIQAEGQLTAVKICLGDISSHFTQNDIQFLTLLKQEGWDRRSPVSRGINNIQLPKCERLG